MPVVTVKPDVSGLTPVRISPCKVTTPVFKAFAKASADNTPVLKAFKISKDSLLVKPASANSLNFVASSASVISTDGVKFVVPSLIVEIIPVSVLVILSPISISIVSSGKISSLTLITSLTFGFSIPVDIVVIGLATSFVVKFVSLFQLL